MVAVLILMLLVLVAILLFLVVGVGHLGNIAGALGHIAQIWTSPADANEASEERRGH